MIETAVGYGLVAVISGVGIAFAASVWDDSQKRQAVLAALPAGHTYSNCGEVRAAGVAPIYRGEPGFTDRLDGDGDGVGCEPYRGRLSLTKLPFLWLAVSTKSRRLFRLK